MGNRLITPSQLSLFSISPVIGAWWEELQAQNLFEGSKPAVSELDQQLFADGLRHEQVLLSKLEKEGRSIARLPGKQTEADYAATRQAMTEGVEFIHQASLCNEEMRGSADFLRRIDRPSLLGEWSYIPIECKLASKPKTTFLVQASAYCELLTPLLGHRPDQFELYLGGGKFKEYATDQFWAIDFQLDATADGRRLKFLNVIDEYSRLCLAIRVDRRCKAKDVVAVLEELTSVYPAPTFIRSDNGPEFIAHALRKWCQNSGTSTAYIEPGAPWQNGFAESFNSRFRDEFLNTELFATVAEAQGLANRWPRDD